MKTTAVPKFTPGFSSAPQREHGSWAAPKKSSEEQKARFQSWHMTWHLGRKVFKQPYKPSIKGLLGGWVTYCLCEAWSGGENLENGKYMKIPSLKSPDVSPDVSQIAPSNLKRISQWCHGPWNDETRLFEAKPVKETLPTLLCRTVYFVR